MYNNIYTINVFNQSTIFDRVSNKINGLVIKINL